MTVPDQTAREPDDRDVSTLGQVNGVEFTVHRSPEPWVLPLDALIISAGQTGGMGSLGYTVKNRFPRADWESLDLRSLAPDTPQVLELATDVRSPQTTLRFLIVVTVRDQPLPGSMYPQELPATAEGIARATAAAIRTARQLDVRGLGIPLIGAGSAGLSETLAASTIISQIRETLANQNVTPPFAVTFICLDPASMATIQRTWSEPAPTLGSPGDVQRPPTTGATVGVAVIRPSADELLSLAGSLARARGAVEVSGIDVVIAAANQVEYTELNREQLRHGSTASLFRSLPKPPGATPRAQAALAAVGVNPEALTSAPRITADHPSLASLVTAARSIARQSASDELWAHHIVAAALVGGPLPGALVDALGMTQGELARGLRAAIAVRWPKEAADQWDQILSSDLVSDFRSDYVPTGRFGLRTSERPLLADHLGVDVYVSMLASLIAREATPMPVSIGLFGEWGSGKSYFMELVRQRVDELSKASGPYHRDILQLTFNAWHYADTNLWASLATEFFDQLAKDDVDPIKARREAIQAKRKESQQVRLEMEATLADAETRIAELRIQLTKAAADRDKQRRYLDGQLLRRTAKALAEDPLFLAATERLGLQGQPEEVLRVARETLAIRDDLAATRRIIKGRQLLLPFSLMVLALAAFSAALLFPDWVRWFRGGAVASITLAVTALGAGLSRVRTLVANLRRIAERAEVIESDAVVDDPALTEALRTAEATESNTRARLDEIVGLVTNLDRQLLELAPSQRLYRFLAERAASNEYRSQLGVVSLVRRDFEELVRLMHTWRAARDLNGEDAATQPIDRIVLYIDDLDRCEPDQVVAVLQAVHLLLAMDLFVVVVGVDPRWLLRSLSTRYEALLRLPQEGPPDIPGSLGRASPHDYLEKIFQVPFVLPTMDRDDLSRLLRHLTSVSPTAAESPHSTLPAPAERPTGGSSTPLPAPDTHPRSTGVTPLPAEAHSEVAELSVGRVQSILTPITGPELALLGQLSGLVRTPRAATRLLNIYGLLRSTRSLHTGSDFLGAPGRPGTYQAVGQLLGILVGAPHLMGPLLWGGPGASAGLCCPAAPVSWDQFVHGLAPRRREGGWSNQVADLLSAEDAESWDSLSRQLNALLPFVDLHEIEPYQTWGPRIARFSFVLSPFASSDNVENSHP